MPPEFRFTRPAPPPPAEWLPFLDESYGERWFSNRGPLVRRLEQELTQHVGLPEREAVAVSSGTSGLTAALLALGAQGRVAVPSFTFPATAHAVVLAGCTPVLCDADPETWEMSAEAAERAITQGGARTLLHVRSYGLGRDLTGVEAVAKRHGVGLVIDSAGAYGGVDQAGRPIGAAGDAEVFSFHATKVFAAGEGGAVLTTPATAERVRQVSNFALDGSEVRGPGLNAKMSEFTAAVALAMLRRLDAAIEQRRVTVAELSQSVAVPAEVGRPVWQCLPTRLPDRGTRDRLLKQLNRAGVEARAYYSPGLHRTEAFRAQGFPASDQLADAVLCLPLYSESDQTARYVSRVREVIDAMA